MEPDVKQEVREEKQIYHVRVTGTSFERLKKMIQQCDKHRNNVSERSRKMYGKTKIPKMYQDTSIELLTLEEAIKELQEATIIDNN